MKVIQAAICIALAGAGAAAWAQGEWEVIGSRDVGFAVDHDAIAVRGSDRHRQMRICAFGGAVHMIDLDIRFANGGHQDVPVRSLIRAGTCTRDIDLIGANRNMTRIDVVYQRVRLRANPQVRVLAR